jgi:hypothetical protein
MSTPSSPVASEPDLLVLVGLRLKNLVEAGVVAGAVDLPLEVVERSLRSFEDAGFVRHREGRLSGWMLTTAGRAEGERLLAEELDRHRLRDAVDAAYRRFLGLNQGFLGLCTDWQQREPGVLNDHTDPDYDAAVIARLVEADTGVQPVCAELAGLLQRFGGYDARFGAALDRVRSGEQEWFLKPLIDSYHTVWFELHEHLLATLGIDRSQEKAH